MLFKIYYKSGKSHTNDDALSWWPLSIDDEFVLIEKFLQEADDSEPKIVIIYEGSNKIMKVESRRPFAVPVDRNFLNFIKRPGRPSTER